MTTRRSYQQAHHDDTLTMGDAVRQRVLPAEVELRPSTIDPQRTGIFCTRRITRGARFGPLEGQKSLVSSDSMDLRYVWEVVDTDSREFLFYLDATDPEKSNWMRHIHCARYFEEQNIVCEQDGLDIIFRAIKDIEPEEELLTWFEEQPLKNKTKNKKKKEVADNDVTAKGSEDGGSSATSPKDGPATTNCSGFHFEVRQEHVIKRASGGGTRFRCEICAQEYKQPFSLKRHYLRTHISVQHVVQADAHLCGIATGSEGNAADAETKLYRCNRCVGTTFDLGSDLRAHLLTAHVQDAANENGGIGGANGGQSRTAAVYECNICNISFGQKKELVKHRSQSHPGEKFYNCEQCDRKFTCLKNMKRHQKLHDTPSQCHLCDATFTQLGDMRKHMKSAHQSATPNGASSVTKAEKKPDTSSGPSSNNESSIQQHTCTVCKKRFSTYANMCRHRRQTHIASAPASAASATTPAAPAAVSKVDRQWNDVDPNDDFYINLANNIRNNLVYYVSGKVEDLTRAASLITWREKFSTEAKAEPDEAVHDVKAASMTSRLVPEIHTCTRCERYFLEFDIYREHMREKHGSHVQQRSQRHLQDWDELPMDLSCSSGTAATSSSSPEATAPLMPSSAALYECTKCGLPQGNTEQLHCHIVQCAGVPSDVTIEADTVAETPGPPSAAASAVAKETVAADSDSDDEFDAEEFERQQQQFGLCYNPLRHVRRRSLSNVLDMHRCSGCKKRFSNISVLEKHVRQCEQKDQIQMNDKARTAIRRSPQREQAEKHQCLYCLREYAAVVSLRRHVQFCVRRLQLLKQGNELDAEWEEEVGFQDNGAHLDVGNNNKRKKQNRTEKNSTFKRRKEAATNDTSKDETNEISHQINDDNTSIEDPVSSAPPPRAATASSSDATTINNGSLNQRIAEKILPNSSKRLVSILRRKEANSRNGKYQLHYSLRRQNPLISTRGIRQQSTQAILRIKSKYVRCARGTLGSRRNAVAKQYCHRASLRKRRSAL